MAFRDIFEELFWELCHGFHSVTSAMLCLFENSSFPDKNVMKQDMWQNLPEEEYK